MAIGGRTGRDGIHGATFSSAELTSESETVSGGAVQIGNAITEKMVLDVLLQARDRGLYNAVTDCGAGGFSSAVGEMGEEIGAEVWLEQAPLKYEGLVVHGDLDLRGPGAHGPVRAAGELGRVLRAVRVGGRRGDGHRPVRADRPAAAEVPRPAGRRPEHGVPARRPPAGGARGGVQAAGAVAARWQPRSADAASGFHADTLLQILGSLNVASKEWVIRQYDHEVQGGSVIKPLVGVDERRAQRRGRPAARAGLAPRPGRSPAA